MANFVSYANATSLMNAISDKIKELGGAYKFRGSVNFADLPSSLTESMVGYVYNIKDDFTTTDKFIEGSGKKYSAGTNVAVAEIENDGEKSYLFDVTSSFVDVDAITTSIKKVSNSIAGDFDKTKAYETGDIVVYDGDLYKFKSDHAAGEWDASEAEKVTVAELIAATEPDALTTEQVNALIDLL